MKNIHVLPTDKPSRLWINNLLQGKLELSKEMLIGSNTAQNIYITSDEKIKVGDWVYCLREGFEPILKQKVNTIGVNNDEMMKKIILTTDQDLIKDGVQAIDDEFLEWFIKNPSCEEVEIIYGLFNATGRQVDPMNLSQNHSQCVWKYKIIIPEEEPKFENSIENTINVMSIANSMFGTKEEPKQCCDSGIVDDFCINTLKCKYATEEPKQETLEVMKDLNYYKNNAEEDYKGVPISVLRYINELEKQQERMYSEEDMKQFGLYLGDNLKKLKGKTIDEIFEQFKKK